MNRWQMRNLLFIETVMSSMRGNFRAPCPRIRRVMQICAAAGLTGRFLPLKFCFFSGQMKCRLFSMRRRVVRVLLSGRCVVLFNCTFHFIIFRLILYCIIINILFDRNGTIIFYSVSHGTNLIYFFKHIKVISITHHCFGSLGHTYHSSPPWP